MTSFFVLFVGLAGVVIVEAIRWFKGVFKTRPIIAGKAHVIDDDTLRVSRRTICY